MIPANRSWVVTAVLLKPTISLAEVAAAYLVARRQATRVQATQTLAADAAAQALAAADKQKNVFPQVHDWPAGFL